MNHEMATNTGFYGTLISRQRCLRDSIELQVPTTVLQRLSGAAPKKEHW